MATATANPLLCPKFQMIRSSGASFLSAPLISTPRFSRNPFRPYRLICAASSAAGSPNADPGENPYEVLGVSPITGFDKMKTAYTRRYKDAEKSGDEESMAHLSKAYDQIMMSQLSNRKKGLTFGSFQVSKDIKYADKQPIVPWGPRFSKSSVKDIRINLAVSAAFIVWIIVQRNAEWKPLQFLTFAFFYRIFEKLKTFEPTTSTTSADEGEDEGRVLRMGKRLLRSISLVFGCIVIASLGFTGILNLIELLGHYIPAFLYNNQELFVTAGSSVLLHIVASYYR